MKLSLRIYLAALLALAVGALYILSNQRLESLLTTHRTTQQTIGEMRRLEAELNQHLLRTAYQLYYDFDHLHTPLNALRERLDTLRLDPNLGTEAFAGARRELDRYARSLEVKEEAILRFGTVNSLIKNSTTLIPSLSHQYLTNIGGGEGKADLAYQHEISHITSVVFIANRSLDEAFLDALALSVQRLEGYHFEEPRRARFHTTFLAHARVFLKYLPLYRENLDAALSAPTDTHLQAAATTFDRISETRASEIRAINGITTAAFIAAMALVIYLMLQTARLHLRLEESATRDTLTGLPNRFAYERDCAARAQASLLLVNIDRFRAINDFYGSAAGDALLRQVAQRLAEVIGERLDATLYRLGADEFCILTDGIPEELGTLPFALIEGVEAQPYPFAGHILPLAISVGVSREAPLLEKADMALQFAKNWRGKVMEYHRELGIEKRVENNLKVMEQLRRAIERRAVIPHFQPIFESRGGRLAYYECLMRIEDEQGALLYPNAFLDIARRGRLHGELTRLMIEKCVARFAPLESGFSINLSVEDILDPTTTSFLFETLEAHPGVGRRLSLEILESEEIDDYEQIQQFTEEARRHGCKIAIDDFGSGYSSLAHVLHIRPDNLKIDGSLVRNLDSDPKARALVAAIVEFAAEIGIASLTAEFVHNQAVHEQVTAMGITYSQGFHLGKPEPELLPDATGGGA